jgi:hypothetical protein
LSVLLGITHVGRAHLTSLEALNNSPETFSFERLSSNITINATFESGKRRHSGPMTAALGDTIT